MDDRPTLEEQLYIAKVKDRVTYSKKLIKTMMGEKTIELYFELFNPPTFVVRDAMRLLAEIMTDHDYGHPTPVRYIRKPENAPAFAYLVLLNLVGIQECPYLGIFKKKVITLVKKTSS